MGQERPFLVLRYCMVEEDQRQIEAKALPAVKGKAVIDALIPERDWIKNGVSYRFVGFSTAVQGHGESFPQNRFYVGKVAKLRKARMGEKVPGDIVEHEEDDWIPLITIVDTERQFIFVQKDWRVGNPQQICTDLESGLRETVLSVYNQSVVVEFKPTEGKFWEVVRSHKKIYKLEHRLISQNILQTNVKARDALSALKELFRQDEICLKLTNESGSIEVPNQPTTDYIEYIEEGEGSWRVTTEGDHGGKKSHSSADAAETLDLEVLSDSQDNNPDQLTLNMPEATTLAPERGARIVARVFRYVTEKLRP